jgi:hypothetical protein
MWRGDVTGKFGHEKASVTLPARGCRMRMFWYRARIKKSFNVISRLKAKSTAPQQSDEQRQAAPVCRIATVHGRA